MTPPAGRLPLVISHRTNMGTMPENTLAGVDAALADGADGVEIDVRATADAVPVLSHDATLERAAGDARAIGSLTLDQLRSIAIPPETDASPPQRVPTLEEVIARVAGRCLLVVEVKQPDIEELVAGEIRRAGATRWCWIWAFDPAVGAACRRVLPDVPVALNTSPDAMRRFGYSSPIEVADREGFAAISCAQRMVTAELVSDAGARGLAVYTWTVNERDDVRRVAEAGVEAICGDFPDRIRRTLEECRRPT